MTSLCIHTRVTTSCADVSLMLLLDVNMVLLLQLLKGKQGRQSRVKLVRRNEAVQWLLSIATGIREGMMHVGDTRIVEGMMRDKRGIECDCDVG